MNEIMTVRAEATSGGTVTWSRPRIHTTRTVSAPATPPAATFVVGAIDGCVIACRFPAITLLPLLLGGYSWSQRLVLLSAWPFVLSYRVSAAAFSRAIFLSV